MSVHKSLQLGSGLSTARSVWTRRERIERLREEGRVKGEEGSPLGLPKVRTKIKPVVKKKKDAAPAAAASETPATE
jgi:small basic protein (TIGR04137 family)